jgi:Cu+-exporting ATPase
MTDSASTATVELAITGMHCGSCVELIQETLTETPGVTSAVVDLDSAIGRVTYDPRILAVQDLCKAVVETGYAASAG